MLTDLGAEVPIIHAEPALLSGNTELQEAGVAVIAGDPAAIDMLSPEALATVLARMPVEDAVAYARRLPTRRLGSAVEALLVARDRVPQLTFSAAEERRVATSRSTWRVSLNRSISHRMRGSRH